MKRQPKAARRKKNLNGIGVEELTAASIGTPQKEDFSDVTGKWTPDRGFDEVLAAQRKIDRAKWK
jgi:hypothetical protein